jgi:septal ring factor EnvC (AmiA/AmiB activator)
VDADLRRLADAAEALERQAGELREQIAELANAVRKRAEAEAERAVQAPEQAESANGSDTSVDDSEARLVAYSMVLDGKPRDEVERHLQDELGLTNTQALLDDLYERAGT